MTDESHRTPRRGDYKDQIASSVSTERWGLGDAVAGIVLAFLLSNIVGVGILLAAGWRSSADIPMWGFGVLQIPLWGGYIGVAIYAAAKGSGVERAFGLVVRAFDPIIGLTVGVICQLLVLPAIYFPIFRITGTDSEELSRPAKQLASGAQSPWGWALFAVLVGLVAPVVEELFFRGLLLRSLSKKGLPAWSAVLISAGVFASLHFQVLQFPGLFVFGIVLAVMAVASGRLGWSVFAHIGFNVTTVVVLYLDYRSK